MKKQYLFLLSLALVFSSCEKNFEVTDSGSLSGSQTTEMAEQDPGFLTSYVNGLYSWMVAYGGNHDCFSQAGQKGISGIAQQCFGGRYREKARRADAQSRYGAIPERR